MLCDITEELDPASLSTDAIIIADLRTPVFVRSSTAAAFVVQVFDFDDDVLLRLGRDTCFFPHGYNLVCIPVYPVGCILNVNGNFAPIMFSNGSPINHTCCLLCVAYIHSIIASSV